MAKAMRTSISIPRKLKARMEAMGWPLNVSAITCRAIEAALDELEQDKLANGIGGYRPPDGLCGVWHVHSGDRGESE